MTFRCDFYWLLGPLRGSYVVNGDLRPTAVVNVSHDFGEDRLEIYADPDGKPWVARFSLDNLPTENVPEEHEQVVRIVKEHLRTILRALHADDADLYRADFRNFRPTGATPDLNFRIQETRPSVRFEPEMFRSLFSASVELREEMRLFADGQDERVPLQYRFLSLFKLLELHCRRRGEWDEDKLGGLLAPVADRLISGSNGSAVRRVLELRDKCAHIRTGRKKEAFGVTHLNHNAARAVEQALPPMTEACRLLLNQLAEGKFEIGAVQQRWNRIPSKDSVRTMGSVERNW